MHPMDILKSELYVDGKRNSELFQGNNISRIALQEQLNVANSQIQLALAREITKAIIAQKASDKISEHGGQYGAALGWLSESVLKGVNAATAGADTRNWTTLPGAIKFSRVTLPPGEHELVLKTTLANGKVIEQAQTVNTTKARPKMWQTRTFSRLPPVVLEVAPTPTPLISQTPIASTNEEKL